MRRYFYDTEFHEKPNTIDLISIGIVGEHGERFYKVSSDFDLEAAEQNDWIKENVLKRLPPKYLWESNRSIRNAVRGCLRPSKEDPVELWGYYSSYDHVALCWLFGPMVDLPEGMPMFTRDIKQLAVQLGNPMLPRQAKGKHDALEDARHNKVMYDFLKKGYKDGTFKFTFS